MFLQILPPDFKIEPEITLVNKAEIMSFVFLTLVFGMVLLVKFVNKKKPNMFSDIKLFFNFLLAVIKKDLRIN